MYPGSMLWNKANIAMLKRFGWTRVGIIFDHHDSDGLFVKVQSLIIILPNISGSSVRMISEVYRLDAQKK